MTDRPAASLPAGSVTEAEFFLARTEEQRRFRELLRLQVGLSRRRKLLNKIGLMRDDREPDPHPNSPWIFLFHGEGGMGKSTLIRRLQAIAEGKLAAQNPGDRAWVDRFTILKIDWEAERTQRPSLQGPRDQIAARALLDVVFDGAAPLDRKVFSDYEQRLKDLETANEKVSKKLQEEQQGNNPDWAKALASISKGALIFFNRSDFAKDYEGQIDTLAEVTTKVLPQVKTWLQNSLERPELEVFERPDQVLADALGKGLAKLAARKPLLMVLDTYEVVDRPECDAVVRLVMKAAGGRVSWVVAGRSNLRNSGKRGEVYFKGYGDDFPEAKIYAKALDEFGEAEIREYFARKVPDRPIDDADAQAIREFSLGIPFMVAEIVSIWRDCPQLSWQQILAPAPADEAKPPRDRAIAAMTERFLFHCLQQGRDEAARTALSQDLAAIYGLAIMRRPDDRPLLRAMLQTKDLNPTLANLQARYSFVFADQCRLHDNLLAYLRPYLLAAARRESPAVQGLNDRALEHLNERLTAKEQELPELGDRFESENAKALWLDAAHHHFWKAQDPDRDETAAWQFWLGVFVDAWLGDRAFAGELVQVLAVFERCLSADGRRRWGLIQNAWSKRRNFDCDRRKAWLDELDKLARRGWLATDQYPERAATLELERARLLYGQKQYSVALQALESLDRHWADPSPALREAIAALYDDLAYSFIWPKSNTIAVSSPEGLQAAQRACALQPDRTWYLYRWAVSLDKAKRHEEAIAAFQQAIALDPNFVHAHNGLGGAYCDLKRYEEAINAFQQAIALDPKYVEAHGNLGVAYRDLKRYEEAIAAYQQAIALDPNFVHAHNGLGNVYFDLKRYEEATAAYQQAIALDPNDAAVHNGLGAVYRDLKRYEEAIAAFQQAIALDPNDAAVHNGLGAVYRDLKRHEEVIAALQQAINLDPNNAGYYRNLGAVYSDLKRYEEAIAAFQQAINLDSNEATAHNRLGIAYYEMKWYEEARASFQRAIDLDPYEAIYHHNLGNAYGRLKRYKNAVVAYQKAVNFDPNEAAHPDRLGDVYRDLKQYEEAIAAYQQAITIEPSATRYNNLGNAYRDLKRYEEAIAAYQQAIALDPNYVYAHSNLSLALEKLQRYPEAEAAYRQALSIEERAFDFSNLGDVLKAQERYNEAIEAYQKAIAIDPSYRWAYGSLGWLFLQQKNLELAEPPLLKAAELSEDNYSPRFNLGTLRALQGRLDEARDWWQKGLALCPEDDEYDRLSRLIFEMVSGDGSAQLATLQTLLTDNPPNPKNLESILEDLDLLAERPELPAAATARDLLQSHLTP